MIDHDPAKLMFWRNQEFDTSDLVLKPPVSTELEFRYSELRRAGRWIALGLLLLVCASLTQVKIASAQDAAGGWTTAEDIAIPFSEGLDGWGVLVCDPNQNLHILWSKGHDSGSEIYYRTDAEGALSDSVDILALPDPSTIRVYAAVTKPDLTLHLIWQNSFVRGDVYYSNVPLAEAGNARAWAKPQQVIAQADSASVTADPEGQVHLVYGVSDVEGYRNSIYHVQSADSGLTWSAPTLVYEMRSEVPSVISSSAIFDQKGRLHVSTTVRSQEYGVYSELGYIRSLDGGHTWQPYQAIAKQSEATPNVAVIDPFAFGEDEIHLTWHDPRRMHMWSTDGGDTWSKPVQIIELGAGFGGTNYLAKDSAGVLRAVTGAFGGVYVSTFSDGRWLAPEQIENRSMDPHTQSLAVCQGNQLHVVYNDRDDEDTTVWYAHKQVDAPHVEPSPLPTLGTRVVSPASGSQEPTPVADPPADADTSAAEEPTLPLSNLTSPPPSQSTLTPIVISTTSVFFLIAVALVLEKRRSH